MTPPKLGNNLAVDLSKNNFIDVEEDLLEKPIIIKIYEYLRDFLNIFLIKLR